VTPAQRAALDALPPKRRAFVLAYLGECGGNATAAARVAGYAKPHPEGAQLLQKPTVKAAVDALRIPAEDAKVASIDEQREWWTSVMRGGEEADITQRLRASELLGKSQGAFVERTEVSGPAGQPMRIEIAATQHAQVVDLARGSGSE
jgi:phage terminase small subunit